MSIFGDVLEGMALTGLTSMCEDIERSSPGAPIGPQTFDALPPARRAELARKVPKWVARLRVNTPMSVTVNLAKNMQISERLGRSDRLAAQLKLLRWLAASGIALAPEIAFPGTRGAAANSKFQDRSPMEAIAGHFPLSPVMPRVGPSDAESIWQVEGYGLAFATTPRTIQEMPPGMKLPVTYIYAAALISQAADGLTRIFTLESSLGGSPAYCMFDDSGMHSVLDTSPAVTDICSFRQLTFKQVGRLDGVEVSQWTPVK
jgi:hypothetical protein